MPELDIPAFKQPKDSVLCGPTCVRMVLAYHGIKVSLPKIVEKLRIIKTGIYLSDLGILLMEYNFYTELKFWLIGMEPRWYGVSDPDQQRHILRSKLRNMHWREWDACRGKLLKYINNGGRLTFKPVMPSDVERELFSQRPSIISINSRVMNTKGKGDKGHFIVTKSITEKDSEVSKPMLGYLDPWDGVEHNKYVEDVIFYNHIWDGGGLLIIPKSAK